MEQHHEQWLSAVRRRLLREKGNLRNVAAQSGVPYPTLTKITSGVVSDPRVSTVQALHDYFARRPEQAAASAGACASH
ncbi:helix-turn-helix domain-containing protein [Burkholderia sp. 9120]|uniref:helix-turn-helix domain-containing protein n=1 Tax=Burkholderia sp. 9120 TaxID=1500897 RepID=UPI0009DF3552|nr:helix-turn-helix domain-containing protein [Burkholderia sp. 9120]